MSSEDIIVGLIKFVSETGRLPKDGEPGLEDVIDSAKKHFGSLENALSYAGLLMSPVKTRRQHSVAQAKASKTSVWSAYSKDYFLNLLGLQLTSHDSSCIQHGGPTCWERRANVQYACSACRGPIEKGEKYIGRRTLRPGKRGIYGYRGTYITDYYHIVCLLEKSKAEIEKSIKNSSSEIDGIEKEITNFNEEMSLKRAQVEDCSTTTIHAKEDYERGSSWRKIGKWLTFRYTLWSKNREISRLEKEMAYIDSTEIPERKTQIISLKGRINNLLHQLNEIDTRIRELVPSRQSASTNDLAPSYRQYLGSHPME